MRHAARILALCLLLLAPAPPPPHLEADASHSELAAGDVLSIDAHLFDSAAPIAIAAPAGFDLLSSDVGPGRALWRYQVASNAPKGLARFVVRSGGLSADVWVRVGPVVWPPPRRSVYVPIVRR
jgi:hypothetical protein